MKLIKRGRKNYCSSWWKDLIIKCLNCGCSFRLNGKEKIKTNWFSQLLDGQAEYYYVRCLSCRTRIKIFDWQKVYDKKKKEGVHDINAGYVNCLKS